MPCSLQLYPTLNFVIRVIWFSCIHQELNQIDEQFRNTLLSLGTYIIGGTSSMESARLLADALFLRDPYWVKHSRPVYGRMLPRDPLAVIAEEPEFMPLIEQRELFTQRIKRLGLFEFLLRPALGEGSISSAVLPLSIRTVDRNPSTGEFDFPDQERMARLRSLLAARSGSPLERLLAEQAVTLCQGTLQEPPDSGTLPAPDWIDNPINRRELLD